MGMGRSGNQKPARAAEWMARKEASETPARPRSHARSLTHRPYIYICIYTHARLRTDWPTDWPSARWLSIPPGVVGNATLPVALAAGLGGAMALLLIFGIVLILRSRRAARAADPAPGLPLYAPLR